MDFSRYQGPSQEWERLMKEDPPAQTDVTLPANTIRQMTNELRVRISDAELDRNGLSLVQKHEPAHREKQPVTVLLGLAHRVDRRDFSIPTRDRQSIVARIYRPREATMALEPPVYLYFHGGGYLTGTVETEDAGCMRLASQAQVIVVSVNYRHTPEFKHPTQVNDAWDAFEWLGANITRIGGNPGRVLIGGLSAGAGLAAYVTLRQHRESQKKSPRPSLHVRGQLLCIPWLVHPDQHPSASAPTSSVQQNLNAPMLPNSMLRLFTELLEADDSTDPALNAALTADDEVVGLPKTSILIAGQDPLRDEALLYTEKLNKNGQVCPLTIQAMIQLTASGTAFQQKCTSSPACLMAFAALPVYQPAISGIAS